MQRKLISFQQKTGGFQDKKQSLLTAEMELNSILEEI
jgi:hypothetical protein